MRLIESIIDEDRQIPFDIQPDLQILFQYNPSDESDLAKITLSSLMQNQELINDDIIRMVKNIDSDFGRRFDWHQVFRESTNVICRFLDSMEDCVIVLIKPGIHFFSRWRRVLLMSLGNNDLSIGFDPETSEVRDEVIIMRNNSRIKKLWHRLEQRCEFANGEGTKDSLRLIIDSLLKGSDTDIKGLSWTYLPKDRVFLGQSGTYLEQEILRLAIFGAVGTEDSKTKCEILTNIRIKWLEAIDKLKKTVISD